jgi:hypothetical protein
VDEVAELLPLVPGADPRPLAGWRDDWVVVAFEPERIAERRRPFHDRAHEERERRKEALVLKPEEALSSAELLLARLAEGPALHLREVDPEGRASISPPAPCRVTRASVRRLARDLEGAAPHCSSSATRGARSG